MREGPLRLRLRQHPQRLTKPLVRKDGVAKHADDLVDPANPWTHFREATWEEALERAAPGLDKIRDRDGPQALAGFGSAKGSNEEAYLFQKLVRTGFGTNNVDHCTRLCHASSVAALLEGVGSAAVTATFNECKNSDVIIVIGANPTENHPVAATYFKQAAKRGAKLIVMDSARAGAEAPRLAHAAVQARHRRRHAQCACSTSSSARSSTTSNTSRATSRASGRSTSRISRRRRWRRSAASLPTRCAMSRAPLRAPRAPSSSGAWACRSKYTNEAKNNHVQQVVQPAVRGSILDARGVPLADNETRLVVSASRTELLKMKDDGKAVLDPARRASSA